MNTQSRLNYSTVPEPGNVPLLVVGAAAMDAQGSGTLFGLEATP